MWKADAKVSAASKQAKATESKSRNRGDKCNVDAGDIKLVMSGSCCDNAEKVEQVMTRKLGFRLLAVCRKYDLLSGTLLFRL